MLGSTADILNKPAPYHARTKQSDLISVVSGQWSVVSGQWSSEV
jgi:hypothetical protein